MRIVKPSTKKHKHVAICAAIKDRDYLIRKNRIVWINDGKKFIVIPIPSDPISAMKGCGRGEHLFEKIVEDRCMEFEYEG